MKETILNHFGVVGIIFIFTVVYIIKANITEDGGNKYSVLGIWILFALSVYGALHMFDHIGRWILK